MSINGLFFGNSVRIGTSTITRSVKIRFTEAFDSRSPEERTLRLGSMISSRLWSRLK